MILGSSGFSVVNDSPPNTNTREPEAAMAWPERPLGEGPIFWNMYHRELEILNAAKSPKSLPSTPRPPKTYITSSTKAAAWPSRGTGINPMQVNSRHVREGTSKHHVSL